MTSTPRREGRPPATSSGSRCTCMETATNRNPSRDSPTGGLPRRASNRSPWPQQGHRQGRASSECGWPRGSSRPRRLLTSWSFTKTRTPGWLPAGNLGLGHRLDVTFGAGNLHHEGGCILTPTRPGIKRSATGLIISATSVALTSWSFTKTRTPWDLVASLASVQVRTASV